MSLKLNIYPLKERLPKKLIQRYENAVSPHISDNMNRLYSFPYYLRPYHKEGKLLGSALTVKTRPGDNLLIHKAIDMAEPGDVIIVEGGGDSTNAVFGEIMLRLCQKKRIAGAVVDGCIRDIEAFRKHDFPIYAKGVTHRGPYKEGPGEVNVPISIGGLVINPGDLLIGDEDGVVSIPFERAEEMIELVEEQQEKEQIIMNDIEKGTIDRSWIDETLAKKGCEFHDTPFKV
ncbi:RraA family protein [Virgibacillus oceani]